MTPWDGHEHAATEPEEGAEQDRRLHLKRARARRDLRDVLTTPEGRRLIWELMTDLGLYDDCPLSGPEATGAIHTRRAALALRDRIKQLDPEKPWALLHRMQVEAESAAADDG